MPFFFQRLQQSFCRGDTTVPNDNTLEPQLNIQHRSMRSNTRICSGATASETFDNIVRTAANAQTVSISQIPLHHNTLDVEEALPFVNIYDHTYSAFKRQVTPDAQTTIAQVHRPNIQRPTQSQQSTLYPDLHNSIAPEGMQTYHRPTARCTLYGPQIGDTTNPQSDVPDLAVPVDKHFVADIATQQNGVLHSPIVGTLTQRRKPQPATNLLADYDVAEDEQVTQEQTQQKQVVPTRILQPQFTSHNQVQPSTSGLTGKKPIVQIQDGPYGPLI